ncbi:hypothetical protein MHEL_48280 [Mycolicibacterium helvum]|uniref:Uncharacterized protein n=1 Tax=Mycolicibacterium helvum TaxID=1534349 RepID=A0A7I7TE01_9MYCO|nr:hypothetical protein MHEL_48280 [Mycolicibacterium helvum]
MAPLSVPTWECNEATRSCPRDWDATYIPMSRLGDRFEGTAKGTETRPRRVIPGGSLAAAERASTNLGHSALIWPLSRRVERSADWETIAKYDVERLLADRER